MSTFRGAIKRLNCDLKISTIFFDLDNTLIATRKADAKACSKVSYLSSSVFGTRCIRLANKVEK